MILIAGSGLGLGLGLGSGSGLGYGGSARCDRKGHDMKNEEHDMIWELEMRQERHVISEHEMILEREIV